MTHARESGTRATGRRFMFSCACGYSPGREVTLGELQDLKSAHSRPPHKWAAREVDRVR